MKQICLWATCLYQGEGWVKVDAFTVLEGRCIGHHWFLTLEYLEVSIIVLTGQTHIYGPCQPLPSSTLCLSLPLLGFREFNSWDTCGNSQDTSMYVTWMSEGGGYTQATLTQGAWGPRDKCPALFSLSRRFWGSLCVSGSPQKIKSQWLIMIAAWLCIF